MSRSLREYRTIQRWAVGEGASSSAHVVGGARKRIKRRHRWAYGTLTKKCKKCGMIEWSDKRPPEECK